MPFSRTFHAWKSQYFNSRTFQGLYEPCLMYYFKNAIFNALTLLVGWQEGHLAWEIIEWWDAGEVVSGSRCRFAYGSVDATATHDILLQQIQIGFTFLVPAHPGSPGQNPRAICKSAPHPRQPRQHSTTQFFTGRMPFLPLNQQRQSTEGMLIKMIT